MLRFTIGLDVTNFEGAAYAQVQKNKVFVKSQPSSIHLVASLRKMYGNRDTNSSSMIPQRWRDRMRKKQGMLPESDANVPDGNESESKPNVRVGTTTPLDDGLQMSVV